MSVFRKYADVRMSQDRVEQVLVANKIIEEFASRGFSMTVRQLYYQHVARGLIPNSLQSYTKFKNLINDGRMAGLVDWLAIEDRTRNLIGHRTYSCPEEAIHATRLRYKRDLWATQRMRPEVWVEKEAMVDVVGQMCSKLRVDYFACRGYVSQSEQWRAGRRMAHYVHAGQVPVIFHLGDHDPSGIDMTRDNRDRIALFAGVEVQVVRLALNMEQVERYAPPPNPAKVTDARFEGYQKKFGDESWELDALDPQVIQDLIETNVVRLRQDDLWDAALRDEAADVQYLKDLEGGGYGDEEEDDG